MLMKTYKEIVTKIIEDLNLTFYGKINKEKLIECWSEYRKEPDHKYFGYYSTSTMASTYKKVFIKM